MHSPGGMARLLLEVAAISSVPGGHQHAASWALKSREALVHCTNTTDCTVEIQAALSNPALDHIIIPSAPTPWNTLPLILTRSNVVVTLQHGAVLQAKRGFYRGGGDTLLTIQSVDNVTIFGQGASLRMWRVDYANVSRGYNHSENRMGLTLKGVSNLTLTGLTIAETGGDGIFLRWATDVVIRDVVTDGAYRNGLSVISATNLLVDGCTFANTGSPYSGKSLIVSQIVPPSESVRIPIRPILTVLVRGAGTGRWNGGGQLTPMNGGCALPNLPYFPYRIHSYLRIIIKYRAIDIGRSRAPVSTWNLSGRPSF